MQKLLKASCSLLPCALSSLATAADLSFMRQAATKAQTQSATLSQRVMTFLNDWGNVLVLAMAVVGFCSFCYSLYGLWAVRDGGRHHRHGAHFGGYVAGLIISTGMIIIAVVVGAGTNALVKH